MKLPLTLLPTAVLLAGSAHAQLELSAPGRTRTGQETFPTIVQLPGAPVGGSDACATAEALGSATGSIAYNLATATTGTEGQTAFTGGLCNHGCAEYGTGQVAVLNDVWFSWTAPATGRVRLTTCPVQNDTKIAVYPGAGCPTGTSCIACSDNYHFAGGVTAGLVDSILFFDATVGEAFLFQVGKSSFGAALPNFSGSFNIDMNPAHSTTGILDDNMAEADIGGGAATAGNLGLNRLGNIGDTVVISGLSVCWGFLGSTSHVNGTPAYIGLWTDPNDNGNPNDGVLVESVNTTVSSANTDTFVTIPFTANHTISDVYFIGYGYQRISAANFPMTMDITTCDVQPDTAWTVINTGAPANLVTLAGNTVPPTRVQVNCQAQSGANNGLWRGAFSIRPNFVVGPPPVGTAECFGDTNALCPCSAGGGSGVPNPGATGHGCANSGFPTGALLTATGVASEDVANGHAADTVVLSCANMTGPGLFIQSNGLVGPLINFNDGNLCAAAGIIRLGVSFPGTPPNPPGVGTYPNPSAPTKISIQGAPVLLNGLPTPNTKHYQCWYRDIPVFCNPLGHNMSNGLAIAWLP